MSLQTPLAKVKGLGSAKDGTHHWWAQRVTSVALIPLVIWFVTLLVQSTMDSTTLLSVLTSPIHAVLMVVFINLLLYHGNLGMQVIIEDYVHTGWAKLTSLLLVQWVSVLTAVATTIAIASWHFTHLG